MRVSLPIAAAGLLASVVFGVSAAQAKDFGPGDLRVCNASDVCRS